jgi:hypothetical protein
VVSSNPCVVCVSRSVGSAGLLDLGGILLLFLAMTMMNPCE